MAQRGDWSGRMALFGSVGGLALVAAVALPASGADKAAPAAVKAPTGKTLGFAISGIRPAFVETPELTECQNGLQPGELAQLRATPGAIDRIRTSGGTFENRGPNGETPQNSPLVVKDYLPFHELITKTGYGVNLDGTPDGRATPKTCAHEKFTNADGEKIDHQMARVLGCVLGYRVGGQTADFTYTETQTNQTNRYLVEVTGVDSELNDPSVQVNFYKGHDRLVRTSDSSFLAGLSHRIDPRWPRYNMKTTGRIVDGMLITDPIAQAYLPFSTQAKRGERDMRDMTLRLKISQGRSGNHQGILAGYDNWDKFFTLHSKHVTNELNKMSSPSIYQAFLKYADGYPDPRTGLCAYISAAYKVDAVRAIIIHEKDEISARIAVR